MNIFGNVLKLQVLQIFHHWCFWGKHPSVFAYIVCEQMFTVSGWLTNTQGGNCNCLPMFAKSNASLSLELIMKLIFGQVIPLVIVCRKQIADKNKKIATCLNWSNHFIRKVCSEGVVKQFYFWNFTESLCLEKLCCYTLALIIWGVIVSKSIVCKSAHYYSWRCQLLLLWQNLRRTTCVHQMLRKLLKCRRGKGILGDGHANIASRVEPDLGAMTVNLEILSRCCLTMLVILDTGN